MSNFKLTVQRSILAYYLFADEYNPSLSGWETYQKWREKTRIVVKEPVLALDAVNLFEKCRTASREEITYVCTELDHITKEDLYGRYY